MLVWYFHLILSLSLSFSFNLSLSLCLLVFGWLTDCLIARAAACIITHKHAMSISVVSLHNLISGGYNGKNCVIYDNNR